MPKHPKGNYDDGIGTYVIPLPMDEEMPCIIFKKKDAMFNWTKYVLVKD